mmetsp:Transcript_9619/g.12475  ORF Transcript_9619/g.12475 Transcript_9619/m.12475 type:complete len:178 (-) Transcript_9619:254-787(-)
MGVTGRCLHFKNSFFNRQQRNIKSSSTQIENQYILLISLLIKTISNGSCRRFVNDTHYIQSRNGSGIFRSLTLTVVEVCRDSDYSIFDFLSQVSFCNLLHLRKDHTTNLFSLELLALSLVINFDNGSAARTTDNLKGPMFHIRLYSGIGERTTNKTLGIEHGVVSVHGSLTLSSISD